jgi:hypothetical protein
MYKNNIDAVVRAEYILKSEFRDYIEHCSKLSIEPNPRQDEVKVHI